MQSSRLLLALAGACALAQTPRDPDPRIKLALSARPVGREELLQFRSPALAGALQSPAALWDFLTSPQTPYLDRRAAAVQAEDVFPVSLLPKLMAALGELREEEAKDHWGLRSLGHRLGRATVRAGAIPRENRLGPPLGNARNDVRLPAHARRRGESALALADPSGAG